MTSSALVPSASTDRTAEVSRNTAETRITVRLNLDGTGQSSLHTGIGFFDHMLEQIARHGLIDLEVHADGDLHIDGHHTVLPPTARAKAWPMVMPTSSTVWWPSMCRSPSACTSRSRVF